MTNNEKIEVVIITLICLAAFVINLPTHISTGTLALWASALLLTQSLVRDLNYLRQRKLKRAPADSPINDQTDIKQAACFCAESTIGIVGIMIGAGLVLSNTGGSVTMTSWGWSLLALIVLAIGYVFKSYVLQIKPLKIFKDENHLDIVVKWS